jgi:hypothetical protein
MWSNRPFQCLARTNIRRHNYAEFERDEPASSAALALPFSPSTHPEASSQPLRIEIEQGRPNLTPYRLLMVGSPTVILVP